MMMNSLVNKYAQLLVNYCLEIEKGDKLYVTSTLLAEPLVREVYREAIKAGALVDTNLTFHDQYRILMDSAVSDEQLEHITPVYVQAMESYDAYLAIRAPFNLRENQNVAPEKSGIRQNAMKPVLKNYFERTATRDLKRSLCQFPTQAAAQEAGMSLEEYEQFVYGACRLFDENPVESWLEVREKQQKIVDLLNSRSKVRYKSCNIDITFSSKGRKWINSDGRTNMPSGEVYTSPVEDSVNGVIHFDYPSIYMGHEVEGVTLWVKNGEVQKWEAKRGMEFLDRIFAMEGTRRFGEAAIGTNFNIDRFTKNILFDEKIGGTVHMAIGQSYLQAGGKNQSAVHWDMIADMTKDGEVFADDEKIYEKGRFLFA